MADRKQTFTPEFRAEAVRLAQTSGRSRREVAADLGVGLPSLLLWHRIESRLRSEAPEEEVREPEPEAGRKAKRVAQPATLGPFYSYAPPRMGARLGDGEELKKCA